MTVWIETPFDNLPAEGYRRMRYSLLQAAFVAAGHRAVVFASDFNHGTKAPRRIAEMPSDVVLVPMIPYSANVSLRRAFSHLVYARRFERLARRMADAGEVPRPDVVVAAAPTLSAATAAMRLARLYGAKFVLDVQDAWPETFFRLLPKWLRWAAWLPLLPMRLAARRLYRRADLVTGVSARYRELTGRKDFVLAPLGIDASASLPPRAARADGTTRLVYAGNLGSGYGLETVVEAVARDRSLTLDVAGAGGKEAALRSLAAACGAADRVVFHGYLGEAELKALLAQCDVGVIPMRDDSWVGLPNKLFDYLAAGLRVASSLDGECGELLRLERLGAVYDFASPDSFLAALGSLRDSAAALPTCLRAEAIYPGYAARVARLTMTDATRRK